MFDYPIDNELFLLAFLGVTVVALIVLFVWIIKTERRINKLLVGKSSKSIDDSLDFIKSELSKFKSFSKDAGEAMGTMSNRIETSVRAVETIRFNPFKGTGLGGNQSFATVLLNEKGDGVIISSLYSRDRVSVFSKPVKNYVSEFELSNEEKEALNKARKELVA